MDLKDTLRAEGKTRWLDVGSGGNLEEGFYYLDTFPEGIIDPKAKDRYFRVDVLNPTPKEVAALGTFDLVRMQHTFEHFTYEEGVKVLALCAQLLKKGGIIMISVPDLKVHVLSYLEGKYKKWEGFKWWAEHRIPADAPDSFYFSIFAYSMPYESHKWCYDFDGLKYQLEKSGAFKDIKELKTADPLAHTPFTHNRPEEDVCVIAVKK